MKLSLSREEIDSSPPWSQILRNDPSLRVGIEDNIAIAEQFNYLSVDQNIHFSDDENEPTGDGDEVKVKVVAVSASVDTTLRKYQKELAEVPLQGCNSIICAPTGSGKTKVAIHIMLKHLERDPNAKIAFLARNVSLAKQQFEVIKKHLPQFSNSSQPQAFLLTGESKDSMSLHILLPSYAVAVLTPQILVNHLRGRNPLLREGVSSFTMLVFDECHHTREGEPYNKIMYHYLQDKRRFPNQKLPQVIGLTATIGIEKSKDLVNAKQAILRVCGNLDVDNLVIVKISTEELRRIVPVPAESVRVLQERRGNAIKIEVSRIILKLEKYVEEYAQTANDETIFTLVQQIPTDKKHIKYRQWAVHLQEAAKQVRIIDQTKETNMGVRGIIVITQYLQCYQTALEAIELAQTEDVMEFLTTSFESLKESEQQTMQENEFYRLFEELVTSASLQYLDSNPNLAILADVLTQYVVNKGSEARAIVFVSTRMLAQAVASWLNRCDREDIRQLKAEKFTGHAKVATERGMTEFHQLDVVNKFREGTTRVLVATSVAQEGLDIPQCNLTILYNQVGNEVTNVQTRGRCRASDGISIVLGFEDTLTQKLLNRYREELMMDAIYGISNMLPADLRLKNEEYHAALYHQWDLEDRSEEERKLRDPFQAVCHLCRKVAVPSTKIRTIYETHHVSIDRSLFDNIKVKVKDEREMDEVIFVGSAVCLGEPETGKQCGNILGSLMKYKGQPFISLGIRKAAFRRGTEKLRTFKQWKDLPYEVDELSSRDLMSYTDEIYGEE